MFIHLKRSGYDVTVGRIGAKEIDFACEKKGERLGLKQEEERCLRIIKHISSWNQLHLTGGILALKIE